jgi:polyisoprenoid-binding protein YceI
VKLLRPGILLLGWLLLPGPALAVCELPARPGADRHPLFSLDPHESKISFEADARLHTFTGTVGKLSGRVRLSTVSPPNDAEACVQIEAASITTGIDRRDETMRTSHLHTDRYPAILFTLDRVDQIESGGSDRYAIALRGTLALHGVTRSLAIPATAHLSPNRLSIEGEVPLRLSTFQIPIPSFLFISMKDEVMVRFRVRAVRQ